MMAAYCSMDGVARDREKVNSEKEFISEIDRFEREEGREKN